jgi:transcriptional regulator with XRE-family HTH domain
MGGLVEREMQMKENYDQIFGAMVKKARENKFLTQQDLADAVKMSRVSIANIEAGKHSVTFHKAILIAELLEFELKSEDYK